MKSQIILQLLGVIGILSTGIVYGTDMFFTVIGKKAGAMSKDSSLTDLLGHFHLVADKRMPVFGITGILSAGLIIVLSAVIHLSLVFPIASLILLLIHLFMYLTVAKPINEQISSAAERGEDLKNIRELQEVWNRIIGYRALTLTLAMLCFILAGMNF